MEGNDSGNWQELEQKAAEAAHAAKYNGTDAIGDIGFPANIAKCERMDRRNLNCPSFALFQYNTSSHHPKKLYVEPLKLE